MSSVETVARNCLFFEKIAFLSTDFGNRQTANERMDSVDAKGAFAMATERRVNNSQSKCIALHARVARRFR